jgi:hypothetical protein
MLHLRAPEADRPALQDPLLRIEEARHRLEQRRFTGPIGAEQRDDPALRDHKADVAHGFDRIVVDNPDVAKLEERRASG